MKHMKNITITFVMLLAGLCPALAQSSQLIHNLGALGKGINQNVESFCTDEDGNPTVVYYKKSFPDSLIIDRYNSVSKTWRNINRLAAQRLPSNNHVKCIYKNGELFLFARLFDPLTKNYKTGLYSITEDRNKYSIIGDFGNGRVLDIEILKDGKLLILGQFETILSNGSTKTVLNSVLYDGKWEVVGGGKFITSKEITVSASATGDTIMILNGRNEVLKYVYQKEILPLLDLNKFHFPYSGITYVEGPYWVITKPGSDSLLLFDGRTNKAAVIKANIKLSAPLSIVSSKMGIILSMDSKLSNNSYITGIYTLDIKKGFLTLNYESKSLELPNNELITTRKKERIFYRTNTLLIYKEKKYDRVVELNYDLDRSIEFDSVFINVFYDKNKNYIKDSDESLVPQCTVLNKVTNAPYISSTGYFAIAVPHYNDAEFELLNTNFNNCLKLPFSAALKCDNNSRSLKKQTLNFPLQQLTSFQRNLIIKGIAKAKARILDTIPLSVNVFNRDCDLNNSNARVTIKLDSNTILISSNPPYTNKSGQILTYDLTNIGQNKPATVNLEVVYPNTAFKYDQIVKHYLTLETNSPEDSSGNQDSIVQKMTYSYDPNSKFCEPNGKITTNLKTIRYYIDFQNLGNDDARRVTVVDTLDTSIPVYEFQMVGCSHAYSVSLRENIVTWVFDNINLLPKNINEKESQGYIIFEAKLIANLGVGDSIQNKAYIYFDYNEPIITNIAMVRRVEDYPVIKDLGNPTFKVFPNPANTSFTIENRINETQQIHVYNMVGQEMMLMHLEPLDKDIKVVDSWPKGMYFMRSNNGNFQKLLVH